MSLRAFVWVAGLQGITWAERGVLIKMADYANGDGGSVFPSVKTIAEWGEVDERTVQRILARLLARGLIEVVGANGRTGGQHPTAYRIVIPRQFMLSKGTRQAGVREHPSPRPTPGEG